LAIAALVRRGPCASTTVVARRLKAALGQIGVANGSWPERAEAHRAKHANVARLSDSAGNVHSFSLTTR
jgi:hypothetical protein